MSVVLQPTMRMGGRVFWAYFWRIILLNFGIGVVLGVVALGMQYVFPAMIPVLQYGVYAASLVISLLVFAIIFDKRYKHYSVKLVDNVTGEAMPRHWKNGLRPWWSYTWRCILIARVIGVPSGFLLAKTFGPEIKLAQTRAECQQLMIIYKQAQAASDTANMQAAEQAFQQRQCPAAFEPPTEQQAAASKSKALGAQIGVIIGLILALALQFKIFQIVLRKRYERFHVQVTANEGVTA